MSDIPLLDNNPGTISACPHQNCGFRCCEFNQGNYIVLYPGEIAEAQSAGKSMAHLEIIDADYHGGAKAICHAANTATCDNGYKPLDCATYPFFPLIQAKGGDVGDLIKGYKCPLTPDLLVKHEAWVRRRWNDLIALRPEVGEWLRQVELVGYQKWFGMSWEEWDADQAQAKHD